MNLLGIDIGTTSVKAAAFDDKLKCLHSSTADYRNVSITYKCKIIFFI